MVDHNNVKNVLDEHSGPSVLVSRITVRQRILWQKSRWKSNSNGFFEIVWVLFAL